MNRADLQRINGQAPKYGAVKYDGTIPFGALLEIESYHLDNQLKVLLVEDKSAPVVAYHTWFRVGSRNEKPGKTGIAHLFEHLMFNETENLPKGEFDRRLEEVGAESNASTWLDFTQYNISAPKERLDMLITIEADRMQHLVLRDPQVESEKEVVANERRYRVDDDVDGAMNEALWATAFQVHPYKWPTIGWMSDILGFTTQDCAEFYRTYYAPNNATVVVVGDFDPTAALSKISQQYGVIAPSTIPDAALAPEPPQNEPRRVELHKPTMAEKVTLGYHCPALSDPSHMTLNVLSEVLSGGRASRLYKKLVRELEIAAEVRAFVGPFRDPGLFEVYVGAREGHTAEELLQAVDAELTRVCEEPVSEQELARARSRFELGLLHSLETADGKANTIGFYDCVLAEPSAAFERLEALRSITADDVLQTARTVLRAEARTVVIVRPSEDSSDDDANTEDA